MPWSSWRDRPLYVQQGDRVTGRSITAEQYGRFLIDVFEEWVRRDVGEVYVQMFDVALANWVGEPPGLCVHSETCGLALALEHTGDLYSCDHFVEPAYKLGNIKRARRCSSSSPPSSSGSSGSTSATRSRSSASSATSASRATAAAPRTASSRTPDGDPGLNYLCAGFKDFFHHVDEPMRTWAELLAQNRAPSEIVQLYASQDAKRGRNDPCTCGSGRKWKHCHGAGMRVRTSAAAGGRSRRARMTVDAHEVEWQFDALDLRPVLRWLDRARGADGRRTASSVVANGNAVTQVDRYFETDDWRFHRAGYSLRVRRVGRRREAEATLKGLDSASADVPGLRSRREVSERLGAADVPTLLRASRTRGRARARRCRNEAAAAVVRGAHPPPHVLARGRRPAAGRDRARRDRDPPARAAEPRHACGGSRSKCRRSPCRGSSRSFASCAKRVRCSPPA